MAANFLTLMTDMIGNTQEDAHQGITFKISKHRILKAAREASHSIQECPLRFLIKNFRGLKAAG